MNHYGFKEVFEHFREKIREIFISPEYFYVEAVYFVVKKI